MLRFMVGFMILGCRITATITVIARRSVADTVQDSMATKDRMGCRQLQTDALRNKDTSVVCKHMAKANSVDCSGSMLHGLAQLKHSPLHHLGTTLCSLFWTGSRVVIALHDVCVVAHGDDKRGNLEKAGAFIEGILTAGSRSTLLWLMAGFVQIAEQA